MSSFMSRVDTSGDCWTWLAAKNENGYGRAYRPQSGKTQYAHRVAYEAFYGKVPEVVMHSCDNPSCVRPTHLIAGTQTKNMRDMARKARGRTVKLTPDDVLHIRSAYTPGRYGTSAMLQQMYGVSRNTVRQIALRETWKDVK